MAYNIDEDITVGDPAHVQHHQDLAAAVNDLDDRVLGSMPALVELTAEPETGDDDQMQLKVLGVVRSWWNEWRALRGRNPYTSWADALVRAVVENGDNTAGNALEIEDRRTGRTSNIKWGVNWGTGRMTQCDNPVGTVFTLNAGETSANIPATLPAGTLVVRKVA
jgi:hypothetical protein